jgi:GMP synthase (glutamine-hydrolysing)
MKNNIYVFTMLLLSSFYTYTTQNKGNAMKIVCITHADFETPGVIEDWAQSKNYEFTVCKPYKGDKCPDAQDFDFLVVMGGPQDGKDLSKTPYLVDEVLLIQQAITENKTIIGFCLGAQLIGQALGAQTERSPEKEVGVFPITLNEEGESNALLTGFPTTFPVIHWHNDMPGLTSNAVLLASSEGCPRQIIQYAPQVYGFQCHLEITKAGIEKMIAECPGDLTPSRFTQNAEELRVQDYATINGYMIQILDRLVQN